MSSEATVTPALDMNARLTKKRSSTMLAKCRLSS